MNLFGLFKKYDINQGVEEFNSLSDAVLLDVRTPAEYSSGHIAKSINLPLQTIDNAENLFKNKDIPIYVYCQSGGRSRSAASALRSMGFSNVNDLGGIAFYKGKVEY